MKLLANMEIPADVSKLCESLQAGKLLGEGSKCWVFALENSDSVVLKVYKEQDNSDLVALLAKTQTLCNSLDKAKLPFATPLIYEIGQQQGRIYTKERKIRGVSLLEALSSNRKNPIGIYLKLHKAFLAINKLNNSVVPGLVESKFGKIIDHESSIPYRRTEKWLEFFTDSIEQYFEASDKLLVNNDILISKQQVAEFLNLVETISTNSPTKRIIHGNLQLKNFMVDPCSGEIMGLLNFGNESLIGKSPLDIIGMLLLTEAENDSDSAMYCNILRDLISEEFDGSKNQMFNVCRIYYSLKLLHDNKYQAWALDNLRNLDQIIQANQIWPPLVRTRINSLSNYHTPPRLMFYENKKKARVINHSNEDKQVSAVALKIKA